MQTFFPSGYSFSPDKLINNKNDKFIVENAHMSHLGETINLIIIVLSIILLIWILFSKGSRNENDTEDDFVSKGPRNENDTKDDPSTDTMTKFIKMAALVPCVLMLLNLNSQMNETITKTYEANAPFELPIKSNLSVHMLDKQHRPKSIKDHKPYPYKIYLDNSKKYSYYLQSSDRYFMTGRYKMYLHKKVNIGKVQNNKFIPADNDLAAIFYKYHVYIMKHNLADKFSKKIIFKPDGKYLTNNRYVQWVVTNDKDTVLYFDDDSHIVQSKID